MAVTWRKLAWADEAVSLDSLLTTRGDIAVRGATTTERKAVGINGDYLGSNGTDPGWKPAMMVNTIADNVTQTIPTGYQWVVGDEVVMGTGAELVEDGELIVI